MTALQAVPFECATWYGWQTCLLGRGKWEFRDPQFGQLDTDQPSVVSAPHTWAQTAIARRIHALGTPSPHDRSAGRDA